MEGSTKVVVVREGCTVFFTRSFPMPPLTEERDKVHQALNAAWERDNGIGSAEESAEGLNTDAIGFLGGLKAKEMIEKGERLVKIAQGIIDPNIMILKKNYEFTTTNERAEEAFRDKYGDKGALAQQLLARTSVDELAGALARQLLARRNVEVSFKYSYAGPPPRPPDEVHRMHIALDAAIDKVVEDKMLELVAAAKEDALAVTAPNEQLEADVVEALTKAFALRRMALRMISIGSVEMLNFEVDDDVDGYLTVEKDWYQRSHFPSV